MSNKCDAIVTTYIYIYIFAEVQPVVQKYYCDLKHQVQIAVEWQRNCSVIKSTSNWMAQAGLVCTIDNYRYSNTNIHTYYSLSYVTTN